MKKILRLLPFAATLAPLSAFAQDALPTVGGGLQGAANSLGLVGNQFTPGTNQDDLLTLIGSGINIAIGILGIYFVILVILAGWKYVQSKGDEKEVGAAKKSLSFAIQGIAIILASYAISRFVLGALSSAIGGSPTA